MPLWTDSTLKPIGDLDPYVATDGTQYPNTPKDEIPGLTRVTEVACPGNPLLYAPWVIQMVSDVPTQVWTELPLIAAQNNLLNSLDMREQRAETSGTTCNGLTVQTDSNTLARLTSANASLSAGVVSFPYLIGGTWQTIDSATATAMLLAAGQHIQACLINQQALHTAILAATDIAGLEAIDINQGWPI